MRKLLLTVTYLTACSLYAWAGEQTPERELFDWRRLPGLPQAMSGQFAGVSSGALIVAGGAHYSTPLSEGAREAWSDTILVLEPGEDLWRRDFKLGRPLAYGAAVTTDEGLICIGGRDAGRCYAQVFRLQWTNGKIEITALPDLPRPCAYTSAAMVGTTVYVAGGQDSPEATTLVKNFWALDLSKSELRWQELEPWPGAGRILPVAAERDGNFYLAGGAELTTGKDGRIVRRYLADAHRFRPGKGWERIADVPRPAAATSAVPYGQSHILVFGRNDGGHSDEANDILAYHTITDTWAQMGAMPEGSVTGTAVRWQDDVIIIGDEILPGHQLLRVYAGQPIIAKGHFRFLDYAVLGSYLLALLLVGVYFSRREKTTGDFFLGGRRVPWWAAGLSILATQVSSIGFMAIPAKSYATDWVYFLGVATWFIVIPVVIYFYLPFFRRLNVTTAYEYLERRFNVAVRLFGSIAFIFLQLGRMAVVLYLPAIALSSVTGISVYTGILVMGVLCTLYTALGGIEAVIWTDVLQAVILMCGALFSVLIIVFSIDGGIGGFFNIARASGKFHSFNWTWDITTTAVWVVLVGNVFSRLGTYSSDQVVVQRYLTTRDEKQAARSLWTNVAASIPWAILVFTLGTALFVFYKNSPHLLSPTVRTDGIVAWFISQQLPTGLSGLVIAAIFAAVMSSLDSSINSVTAALVTDFYGRFKPSSADHTRLNLARWLTVILGTIGIVTALLMATYEIKSLWDLFIRIVGLLGGGLGGLFALGIFTRRANAHGALIGTVASTAILFYMQNFTHIHFFLYAAAGMMTCFLVGYLTSLMIPASMRELEGLTVYTLRPRKDSY